MLIPKKHLFLLLIWLPLLNVTGQVSDSTKTHPAIMITYESEFDSIKHIPFHLKNLRSPTRNRIMPERTVRGGNKSVLIFADPYSMRISGTLSDNTGYQLHNRLLNRTFYCHQDDHGISFIPIGIRFGFRNSNFTPTGQTDTILGYPVIEYVLPGENGLISIWQIDTPAVLKNTDLAMPNVNLLRLHIADGAGVTTRATSIELIQLHERYLYPERSNAPITFKTKSEAFNEIAFFLGALRDDPVRDYIGYSPLRHPIYYERDYRPLDTGSAMIGYKGKYFTRDKKITFTGTTDTPTLFILVDYYVLQPIPAYVGQWINTLRLAYPEINMVVLTKSNESEIINGWNNNSVLSQLPHRIITKKQYERFEWQDPLTWVITDRHMKIRFKESGFDLHAVKVLVDEIKKLQEAN